MKGVEKARQLRPKKDSPRWICITFWNMRMTGKRDGVRMNGPAALWYQLVKP